MVSETKLTIMLFLGYSERDRPRKLNSFLMILGVIQDIQVQFKHIVGKPMWSCHGLPR